MQTDLKSCTEKELEEIVLGFEMKRFLARYIFSFIHTKSVTDIELISPLPKDFRQKLIADGFYISSLNVLDKFNDPDGTVKYLFELPDSNRIESVLLTDHDRKTLCISTQAGCRMACTFCATGQLGYCKQLSAGQIVDQLYKVRQDHGKINNVVYMGMGEPLDNYDEVIKSVSILNSPNGINIGQRHITISTCGIPQGINDLADEGLQVRLAVSLHAATDYIRDKIMPIGNKYPLRELISSVKNYQQKTKRRITFEYCMIKDLNDSDHDAKAMISLIKNIKANVNIIEYNPHPKCSFEASSKNRIQHFAKLLTAAGLETTIRYRRGRSIKAACGQLGAS